MKNLFLLSVIISIIACGGASARTSSAYPVTGRVVNTGQQPIDYATVVLMNDLGNESGATIAGADGGFSLSAGAGTYQLVVQCLGYEPSTFTLSVKGAVDVGYIVMEEKNEQIADVVVKAPTIKRQADRFVMSVAGTTAAIGKNALEALRDAPGVWITDNKITINGREGVRVMIDGRLLTMTDDELNLYLRNINSEDIQRIEIIPMAGADMDADAKSGMISITLKKQRMDGLEGSAEMKYAFRRDHYDLFPSVSLNYKKNKVSLYTALSYSKEKSFVILSEQTQYHDLDALAQSNTHIDEKMHYASAKFGAIYDINERHSIGAEFRISGNNTDQITDGSSYLSNTPLYTSNTSLYTADSKNRRLNVTVNYDFKIDTLGSKLKVIADYSRRKNDSDNLYDNSAEFFRLPEMIPTGDPSIQTLQSNLTDNAYGVYSVSADLDVVLNDRSKLKTGAKFVYNMMEDNALYQDFDYSSLRWAFNADHSINQDFRERIAAVYGVFSSRVGTVSYSVGLRGEYTYSNPRTTMYDGQGTVRSSKDYFDIFPNANIMIPLNDKQTNSIILSYARKIGRPSFWALNPFRIKASEYSYITGDPNLNPTYTNDLSASLVLANKYNFTLGMKILKDDVGQIAEVDQSDPQIIIYRASNLAKQTQYYANINAPFSAGDWLSLNVNLIAMHDKQRVEKDGPTFTTNLIGLRANANVILPEKFYLEVSGDYFSDVRWGNFEAKHMYNVDLGLKKRFVGDKLTASFIVRNVLGDQRQTRATIQESDFTKHVRQKQVWDSTTFSISLRYNFKTGQRFKVRSVQSSGDDSRMNGN